MSDFYLFLHHLRQPEYIHLLFNPMPVYGLALGIIGLLAGFVSKERRALMVALLLVAVGSASAGPAVYYGHRGYDRVYAMSGEAAQQWLDVHEARAEKLVPLYYATAVMAAVALLFYWKTPRLAKPVAWLTLLLASFSLAAGVWISQAGGQIRHSELREGPPQHPLEKKIPHSPE